jgi:uncharacterized membrane protein
MASIRNPIEWAGSHLKGSAEGIRSTGRSVRGADTGAEAGRPAVREIEVADLKDVLARGLADFKACRTDVIFLCIVYPVVGLVLARFAFRYEVLPMLFPLVSGFALIGPIAAVGLYEMSRRRELDGRATWADAFGMVWTPAFGAIVVLGLVLLTVFLLWLAAAQGLYLALFGSAPPASIGAFAESVFMTGTGWMLMGLGVGIGFVFALVVLSISVVSFPLLLDRDVGVGTAIATSVRAVSVNPGPMALWGFIVAAGLVIGSIPVFLGLIVVMPVLGHATWHLYRKVVPT